MTATLDYVPYSKEGDVLLCEFNPADQVTCLVQASTTAGYGPPGEATTWINCAGNRRFGNNS